MFGAAQLITKVVHEFDIDIDTTAGFGDMVAQGRFHAADVVVNETHFPLPWLAPYQERLYLVKIKNLVGYLPISAELHRLTEAFDDEGLIPAGIGHLLALAAAHPRVQKNSPIVATSDVYAPCDCVKTFPADAYHQEECYALVPMLFYRRSTDERILRTWDICHPSGRRRQDRRLKRRREDDQLELDDRDLYHLRQGDHNSWPKHCQFLTLVE